MKNILILFTLIEFACNNQTNQNNDVAIVEDTPEVTVTQGYDSAFAQRLGADDYGMKKYVMALLKAGPNRNQDSTTAANLQRAHMENIQRLAKEGKLIVAGPFLDGGELKGIYIFDVESIEEAKSLTETDPAIQEGRLVMELKPWYGSAALVEVSKHHEKLSKKSI